MARRARWMAPSTVRGDHEDLGQQRVVVAADAASPPPPRSRRARPGPAGSRQRPMRPGVGAKARAGSSALMRSSMACRSGSSHRRGGREHPPGQWLARRDPELLVDQVDAAHHLGHTVLDLEPGIDLQEERLAGRRQQELGGGGVAQAHRPCHAHGQAVDMPPFIRRSDPVPAPPRRSFWCRRWMEQSRSPSATMATVGVTQQLDLDVSGALDVALQVDARRPERLERLAGGRGHRARQLLADRRRVACRDRRHRRPP